MHLSTTTTFRYATLVLFIIIAYKHMQLLRSHMIKLGDQRGVENILRFSKLHQYHKVLGVERNAPCGVLRKAKRNLSRKYHPDKNSLSSDDAIMAINNAFDILSDRNSCNKNPKQHDDSKDHDSSDDHSHEKPPKGPMTTANNVALKLAKKLGLYQITLGIQHSSYVLVRFLISHGLIPIPKTYDDEIFLVKLVCFLLACLFSIMATEVIDYVFKLLHYLFKLVFRRSTMGSVYTSEGRRSARIARQKEHIQQYYIDDQDEGGSDSECEYEEGLGISDSDSLFSSDESIIDE